MKNLFTALMLVAILAAGTSCATIFSKSTYPISLGSTPSGASVTVVNRAGRVVYTGATPSTVRLKSAAGYMKPEDYSITFQLPGAAPQTYAVLCTLDGWYFANLLLGGLVGMLVVDPASGAMYRFRDKYIHVNLSTYGASVQGRELRIIDIAQVPEGTQLERIN